MKYSSRIETVDGMFFSVIYNGIDNREDAVKAAARINANCIFERVRLTSDIVAERFFRAGEWGDWQEVWFDVENPPENSDTVEVLKNDGSIVLGMWDDLYNEWLLVVDDLSTEQIIVDAVEWRGIRKECNT